VAGVVDAAGNGVVAAEQHELLAQAGGRDVVVAHEHHVVVDGAQHPR
jgi:hypothetical protein